MQKPPIPGLSPLAGNGRPNVNPLDLITGTEHLNHDVMAKFEDQIRDYLNAGYTHKRHVLMRVTPDFRGDDLVARGVQMC